VKGFFSAASLRRDLLGVLVIAVVLGCIGGPQAYHEYLLSRHSQSTEATVVSKYSGHGWIEYQYAVGGHTYEGRTPADSTGRAFDQVKIGDNLVIRFDPTNPTVSGTPETRDAVVSTAPWLGAVVFGLGVVAYIRYLGRRWWS
jgi:hypothetical protein